MRKVQPSPGVWVYIPAPPETSLPTLARQTSPVALRLVFVCGKVVFCPLCVSEGEPRDRLLGEENHGILDSLVLNGPPKLCACGQGALSSRPRAALALSFASLCPQAFIPGPASARE